jgi:hypothetical protein
MAHFHREMRVLPHPVAFRFKARADRNFSRFVRVRSDSRRHAIGDAE